LAGAGALLAGLGAAPAQERQAVAKFDAIHLLTGELAPNEIDLALTPEDVRAVAASGRKVAVIGIENGYPIGTDLRRRWPRGFRPGRSSSS
jgi:membrane dipeptidase